MNESLENSDFNINLDGFEGPIDLLLNLARSQKVDLSKISILHLAEQYLDYINNSGPQYYLNNLILYLNMKIHF